MIHEIPYGWRVTYLRHARAGAGATEATYGAKGTQTNARIRAVHKMGFIRVVKMEPLTREQYEKEFGEPASPFDRRKKNPAPAFTTHIDCIGTNGCKASVEVRQP